jgi:hypothetical protein
MTRYLFPDTMIVPWACVTCIQSRSTMTETPSRRLTLIRFNTVRNINNSRLRPNMHSTPHHLLRNPFKTARLNTDGRSRRAILRNRLMHQPGAALGAEEAFRFAMRVGSSVYGNGTWEWRWNGECWEDGGHAVGRGALMSTFGAVADQELLGRC